MTSSVEFIILAIMKNEIKFYKDIWYKVEYEIRDVVLDFKAYKIIGFDDECETKPQLFGYLKWDGCMEFTQEEHYCGIYHAEQTYMLMKEIYEFGNKLENFDVYM